MERAGENEQTALLSVGRPTSGAKATGIVAAGMMAMNVASYAFTLLSARALGPRDFGAVSALLGILIVANVGSLTLQATGARRLATADAGHQAGVSRDVLRSGRGVALALGAVMLAAVPLMDRLLHLDDWVTAATVGLACMPLTLMGAYAGILQGRRRWAGLAATYVAMGVGRVAGGGIALLVDASLRSAMIGIAVGSVAPAVAGALLTKVPARAPSDHAPVVRELWRNGHTLLAFFAFTNCDVLLARHLFDTQVAGIYAAGAILTKACLFLPTFVLVVAFPTMATDRGGRAWLKPLVAVVALGLVAVAGASLLPGLAVTFAGGGDYSDLAGVAWLFAVQGTIFAALQILVYDAIAAQAHSAFLLWLGVVVVSVVAVVLVDSVTVLVSLVAAVAAVVALVTSLMPGVSHAD